MAPVERLEFMTILYWMFVLLVVMVTFYVIFRSLSKKSYWIMAIIALFYTVILAFSFFQRF
ncbi:hypothetical protein HM131_19715 [Halobacillus mangrovi]|uniref:Uncharacterized protein n=1 Tax=Halobacillus mangrovi TaxID=402384 RepID=A0A1W6A090_9BACI|nr:hypothetical protein HM131_19715 [Halobacillus mangrovi]